MNANLRRVTFVLESETVDALNYVSDRVGQSMSSLARELLGEPIVVLANALRAVPDNPDHAQLDLFRGEMVKLVNHALDDAESVLKAELPRMGEGHE